MTVWRKLGHAWRVACDAARRALFGRMRLLRLVAAVGIAFVVALTAVGVDARPALAHSMFHNLTATPDDWSTFLHDPARTAANSETILSPANASLLARTWSFTTGGVVAASPTVVGGTVYVGSWDGYEYALDAGTGALKWKTFLGTTSAPGCAPPAPGVSSAAAVQNGVVYVGGGDAYWYALDAATGAILWKVFTGDNSATGGHYNWSSPLLANGYAYIGVASLGDCPLVQGQLLQVDLSTHQIANTFNVVPAGQTGGGIWTSPSLDLATNTIFVTTGTESSTTQQYAQALLALDAATLTLKASWKLPEAQAVSDSDFGTTPILFSDAAGTPLVAAINKNGIAYAFNRNNLAAGPVWQQTIAIGGNCPTCGEGSVASGAFVNSTLFLGGGNISIGGSGYQGSVQAFDPASGTPRWQHGTASPVIAALAYTNGLVVDGAGSVLEVLDASSGARLYSYRVGGTIYGAPSVANGRVFAGSVDGNVYAFGLPTTLPPPPPPDPNCPSGWTCQDIGNAAPAGSEVFSGGVWTINAGGAGVGGATDQFRLATQPASGDSQVAAQVRALSTASTGAQAGIMLRQSADATSPYYAVLATPNNGLAVKYRSAFAGTTTTANTVTLGALPQYLEIQRHGDVYQAAASSDGVTYTLVPGTTVTLVMPNLLLAGLATSSGSNGTAGSATYGGVAIGSPSNTPAAVAPTTPCPSGWSCADIGNPKLVGSQSLNSGAWSIQGAGAGISGFSDQFLYDWQSLTGDATVSARVTSQTNTSAWARAGIMLRQSADAGSPYYAMFVTPGHGIIVQYRDTAGLNTTQALGMSAATPAYLQITRSGATFSAFTSADGVTWNYLLGSGITVSMGGSMLAGLAVTSQNAGAISTATFDTVVVSNTAPPPPTACPAGWTCANIGNAQPVGGQVVSNGVWTVQGGGSDIWGTSDQFYYVAEPLVGDGRLAARVTSQSDTDPWAKAGVMLRQSTDPGAAYYAAYLTPGNGVAVQYRLAAGSSAAQLATIPGAAPVYLEVARSGATFTAYTSSDGATWTPVSGSSVNLTALNGTVLAGLAVTSHNSSFLATVNFDHVSLNGSPPPPPATCPSGWNCADVGTPMLPGSQTLSNGVWTVQGGGSDIWGTSDQFHFVWQTLAGDGTLAARVTSQSNTDPWAKAGVMLRQSTDPGAAYYAAYLTPGNGVAVQYRNEQGLSATAQAGIAGNAPVYLRVARSGVIFAAYTSSDGITWTAIAGSSAILPSLSGTVDAGMAITSHNPGALGTATFDTVRLLTTVPPPPPTPCPTGWFCADVGGPALAGGQTLDNGIWAIAGAGANIWGNADQFHFVWQTLTGNGTWTARVTSQTNTNSWAKAGLMLRASTDPGSPYYGVLITPGNGIAVQYRATQGGSSVHAAGLTGTVPKYLRILRSGTVFTAYVSDDGVTWTKIAHSSVSLTNMNGTLLSGLALTSHASKTLGVATLDNVTLAIAAISPPAAAGGTGAAGTSVPTRPNGGVTPSPTVVPEPPAKP